MTRARARARDNSSTRVVVGAKTRVGTRARAGARARDKSSARVVVGARAVTWG